MRIIIDEFNLETYSDAFLVTDDKTFIESRKLILNYKMSNNQVKYKTIVANTSPYCSWFFDIENEIDFECILPSKTLQNKFKNVIIDKELEETDIVLLNLINETIEPTEISIINKYIGPFLLNTTNLKDVLFEITSFAIKPPKIFLDSKYLHVKWSKYLDMIECETDFIRALVSKIKERDKYFCKVINQLVYVSNSKKFLKEFMHDEMAYLQSNLKCSARDLEMFFTESKFATDINEQYEIKIERSFKTVFQEDTTAFFKEKSNYKATLKAYLSQVKSITEKEKEFIVSNYSNILDYEIEEKIKSRIKPDLTPPPLVDGMSLPDKIDAWHNWAVEKFIPFKFYLDEFPNDNDIELVEEYANVYSDWLFGSYSDIIQSGIKTNYNITNKIHDELSDSRVIWLIIDGFPAFYKEILNSILKSHGINSIKENYNFAAIPTITEIGMPTQLGGVFPQSSGYTSNKEEALKRAFKLKDVIFKNSIKYFGSALDSDFDLCCLHWHEIDEFMHKEDNHIDVRRIDEIKRLLNVRIKQIANVIKASTDNKIKLIISTDHGSTKCLTKGLTIKNSSLLEACKNNPKERCVELTKTLSKVHLDENETYYLKKEVSRNVNDWALARGYRYFGRFDYGYRHGGLTPEETIVPFLICETAHYEILPIKITVVGDIVLRLGYTDIIKFVIKNDNDAVVDIKNIQIVEDKNFNITINKKIDPLSSKMYDGNIKLPKNTTIKEHKAQLNVIIDYYLFGEKQRNTTTVGVEIKKSVNDSLDNLFN
jgi:hypothetical protein